jgi:transketolase
MHKELTEKAREARQLLLEVASKSNSVHIGSSLSEIDILVALYDRVLKKDDRFILSKGHAGLGWYTVLSLFGYIPHGELMRYGEDGTKLAVHPVRGSADGVEATSGSLGHGLSMALGMALAKKRAGEKGRVFVLISDGECDEGSTWEAILLAGHLRLDNLVVVVDYNKIQSFGRTEDVLDLEPFADKWRAARWGVKEIDGHSFEELRVLEHLPLEKEKPSVSIAHTIKGKGVSFMEDTLEWHYFNLTPEKLSAALKELA